MRDYTLTAKPWSFKDPLPWWQWLKEEPVVIIEENELPAWKDPEQIYQAVRKMGANHVRYPAICWGAHFYGESKSLPKFFTLDPASDYYGSVSACMKKHGIKIMAYAHYGVLYREFEHLHPEWLAKKSDGSYWIWNDIHRMCCLASDTFTDAMRTGISEIIEQYQPDSIYLDGPAWYHRDCHCDWCKQKYKSLYGQELPDQLIEEDGSLHKYHMYRDVVHLDVVKGIHELTQAAGIPLQINTSMFHTAGHRHGFMELNMAHCEGANTTEVHRGSRFWSILLSAKLGESLKRVSMAYCPPGPYESLRTHDFLEALVTGIGYAMHGGTLMLEPGSCYFYDDSGSRVMQQLNKTVAENKALYYRTQPVKELALVLNNNAFDTMDQTPRSNYLRDCLQGAFEALSHSHRHFDCLFDAQLSTERIRDYRALFMPMATCFDEHQAAVLKDYVASGGALILGPEASLYDEQGRQQASFQLEELMGVTFKHENDKSVIHTREYRESAHVHPFAEIPEAYINLISDMPGMKASETKPIITSDAVVGDTRNRIVDYKIVTPHRQTRVLAELYLPAGGAFGAPFHFPEGSPPAITEHVFGKGRVFYVSCHPWQRYLVRGLKEQRNLIRGIVDHALSDKPVLDSDAPAGVLCYLTEDEDGRYLHLLNYCGTMLERSAAVEWIAPLVNLTFKVRCDQKFSKIDAVFDDAQISYQLVDGYYEINLDRLQIHQTVRMYY